ncbi:hypothetical protein ANN_18733, partial [Periplaneta americana]
LNFWLEFFHHIMPHMDILYNQLQHHNANSTSIYNAVNSFLEAIMKERNNKLPSVTHQQEEKQVAKSCPCERGKNSVNISGLMKMYEIMLDTGISDSCTEVLILFKIIVTAPMTTAQPERYFSTLKKVKTFLRNTMTQDCLAALAMLSVEKSDD